MKNKQLQWLTKVAILAAMASILMLLEFPLPFIAPSFYELDFSEVPVLIGAFSLGPIAGVVIEAIKILLNFIMNGSITGGVGELSNFVLGVVFVLPAALIYKHKKTKLSALLGLVVGGLSMVVLGCFINAYVMLPLYSNFMPLEAILAQAAAIWPVIDNTFKFVLLCVAPFNLIKVILVSAVTMLLYKRLSPLLKGKKM
ncbi:MAG: ECF transporter S component [Ruminococcaceae bacterium]|nr:ECF transporter S component [Oscillospiraceae bacterium]